MKVIWRNNKSGETYRKNIGPGSVNQNELKKPSSHNSLTKMKGYNHRINNVTRERCSPEPKTKIESGYERGLKILHANGDTATATPIEVCRVCSRTDDLRCLGDCIDLLDRCFGVKVQKPDTTAKICNHCADLIIHTYKFKEMISAAFQTTASDDASESFGLLKEGVSFMSIAKPKTNFRSGSEEMFVRNINTTKRNIVVHQNKPDSKKTIVACSVCKQKYTMVSKVSNFVCCRCKVKSSSSGRTVVCVKCKATVPCSMMKEHLERHAKADLKGRCRLRSLTKQPSIAQTECVSKSHKQAKLNCPRCQKSFNGSQLLEKHLRDFHGTILTFICQVCNKDMRSAEDLEAHMKNHICKETYECEICGRIFKDKSLLEKHTTFHEGRLKQ